MNKLKDATKKATATAGGFLHDGEQAIKSKADKIAKKALKLSNKAKENSMKVMDKALNENVSTKTVSGVGFWSGLSSIVVGFPANVLGIVSGHIVEDRRKMSNNNLLKKSADNLVPTKEELNKSRIGAVAGYVSLIGGIIAVASVISHLQKKSGE